MTNPPEGHFIDNPLAPEVFITGVSGYVISPNGAVVTLTLESARVDHSSDPGPVNRVVIGRVTMPTSVAQNLAVGLFNFLKRFDGNPTDPPTGH